MRIIVELIRNIFMLWAPMWLLMVYTMLICLILDARDDKRLNRSECNTNKKTIN